MRPQLWTGRYEGSKEEETRQSRLLPMRRQTPIVTRGGGGLVKAASVHAAFVVGMTKACFTLRVYLCHLRPLETSVFRAALVSLRSSVRPKLPLL